MADTPMSQRPVRTRFGTADEIKMALKKSPQEQLEEIRAEAKQILASKETEFLNKLQEVEATHLEQVAALRNEIDRLSVRTNNMESPDSNQQGALADAEKLLAKTESAYHAKIKEIEQARDAILSELQSEIALLKRDVVAEDQRLQLIPANQIGLSKFANRYTNNFDDHDPEFLALRLAVREAGTNPIPIKVRKSVNGPLPFEQIYGSRRRAACEAENLPCTAIVCEISEEELVNQLHQENRYLKPSAMEDADFFGQVMQEQMKGNQTKLGERFGLSKSEVSKYIAISQLPEFIRRLFPDLRLLKKEDAYNIFLAWKKDPKSIQKKSDYLRHKKISDYLEIRNRLLSNANMSAPASKEKPCTLSVGSTVVFKTSKNGLVFEPKLSAEQRNTLLGVIGNALKNIDFI